MPAAILLGAPLRADPLITTAVRERESRMLARIMADGGFPRVEIVQGRAIWVYPGRSAR